MHRREFAIAALALGAGMALRHGRAAADEPVPPAVNAQRFREIPEGLAIAVEPRDDSDENLALGTLIRDALAERHRTVAEAGPLRLRFASAVLSDRDLSAGTASGRGGERGAGMGRRGGALPPGRAEGGGRPRPVGAVRHRVTASLEQRIDGAVLWRGEVTVTGAADDRQRPRRLAAALAEALGDTRRPAPPPERGTPPAR